ncbi:hypothetical protein ES703_42141 [subsurface metagenome]
MKLSKAIKTLTGLAKPIHQGEEPDITDAIKLGIKTLNYVMRLRACSLEHRQAFPDPDDPATPFTPTQDEIKALKESPLGREPKA